MPQTVTQTPAVVNSQASTDQTPGATHDIVLSFSPTAGNALVLVATAFNESDALAGVSDDQGGSWTLTKSVWVAGAQNPFRIEVWQAVVVAGVTTVTVDYGGNWGGQEAMMQAIELSGVSSTVSAIRLSETSPYNNRTFDTDSVDGTTQIAATAEKALSLCFTASIHIAGGQIPEVTADATWTDLLETNDISLPNIALHSFVKIAESDPANPETITLVNDDAADGLHAILLVWDAYNVVYGDTFTSLLAGTKSLADMSNSSFISDTEWTRWLNDGMNRLYDLMVSTDADYFESEATITTVLGQETYDMPERFYKLLAIDVEAGGDYYRLFRYNRADRNVTLKSGYRPTVTPVRLTWYRLVGDQRIRVHPAPEQVATLRIRYVPFPQPLVQDAQESLPDPRMEHWGRYIRLFAAIQAKRKEDSNVGDWMAELKQMEREIREAAEQRDAHQPERVVEAHRRRSLFGLGYIDEVDGSL